MRVLQPLRWRCVECAIHHERDVREEQQCEGLRTCRSGFPIATVLFRDSAKKAYKAKSSIVSFHNVT